eukprot:Pgem_evm1s10486
MKTSTYFVLSSCLLCMNSVNGFFNFWGKKESNNNNDIVNTTVNAVGLINYDEQNNYFYLNKKGEDVLKSFPENTTFRQVSILSHFVLGKSNLLNSLINNNTFSVFPEGSKGRKDSTTKAMDICPVLLKTPKKNNILYVDNVNTGEFLDIPGLKTTKKAFYRFINVIFSEVLIIKLEE